MRAGGRIQTFVEISFSDEIGGCEPEALEARKSREEDDNVPARGFSHPQVVFYSSQKGSFFLTRLQIFFPHSPLSLLSHAGRVGPTSFTKKQRGL